MTETVGGAALRDPAWVTARIAEMGRSWGTDSCRAAGTLWWCMVASALVQPVVRAYVAAAPVPAVELDRINCPVRADGGIETVLLPADPPAASDLAPAAAQPGDTAPVAPASATPASATPASATPASATPAPAALAPVAPASAERALFRRAANSPAPDTRAAAQALRASLASVIATVAQASGAGIPALWAVVADAIGNRAIDAGAPAIAPTLAHDVGGKLPTPRFQEVAGRTFVKRISCCLVFEAPGCAMCTSCPKRPAAEREQLLTALTTGN
ncbi:(2Fe-2S)-binding protein [Nocardia sp. NPDC057227]|uniref:(2Fe-2S)-binding protein n=1 Tax=Nocardia sp. NPDC057227 TaxID=3346056 RepID=UPI00362941AF